MADLYRVEITEIAELEVQARLVLINVQASDLPAKHNVALQVVTETFYELFSGEYELLDAFDSAQHANYDALSSIEKRVCLTRLAFHMKDRYALFRAQADKEIVWVKSIGDANFDRIEDWEEALYDDRTPEVEPWTEIRFRVRDESILVHLKVGTKVRSSMFDKAE